MSNELNKAAAIFGSPTALKSAIDALSAQGFEDISVLIKNDKDDVDTDVRTYSTATYPTNKVVKENVESRSDQDNVSTKDPNALNTGSVTGGVLGAIAGLGALLIPGVGPVLATGTLASAIGAMAAGGAVGMTAGAIGGIFKDEGLPSDRVDVYRQAFDQGKGILVVDASETQDVLRARDILNQHRPEHIDTF